MPNRFDDEVLLLRPVNEAVDEAAIERHLAQTPGAFRDPHDPATWILAGHPQYIEELRRQRIEAPTRYVNPRVIVSPRDVVVVPGGCGHARKFVHWLLSQSPCDLSVRGEVIGRVSQPLDIYAETEWDDPDANLDPTEAPPRTGTIVAMIRYHQVGGMGEEILVHDTGIMSYEQSYPVKDSVKTYRRLPPELLRQWLSLVNGLPLDADAPGPDDEYIDPVFLSVETPIDSTGTSKLDAARPTQPYREFMSLVNSWAVALRADRAAMPTGLLAYP